MKRVNEKVSCKTTKWEYLIKTTSQWEGLISYNEPIRSHLEAQANEVSFHSKGQWEVILILSRLANNVISTQLCGTDSNFASYIGGINAYWSIFRALEVVLAHAPACAWVSCTCVWCTCAPVAPPCPAYTAYRPPIPDIACSLCQCDCHSGSFRWTEMPTNM